MDFFDKFVAFRNNKDTNGYVGIFTFCSLAYFFAYVTNYNIHEAGVAIFWLWIASLICLFLRNIGRSL